MLRVSAALLLFCLAGPHALSNAEVTCSITGELNDSFGTEDGTAAGMVLESTLLSQVPELPSGLTLLVPSRKAWLDFFHVLGFNTITSAMRNATTDRHLKKLINSLVLYHVVATPDMNATVDELYVPVRSALAGYNATLVYGEGADLPPTAVEGLVTGARVAEVGESCGTPALLLDAVLLPDQLYSLPGTSSLRVASAVAALAAGGDVASPPPPAGSPAPPAGLPPPAACPYATWAEAVEGYPDLTILEGLMQLANMSLSVLGGPEDGATIMLPTSSAMLNAIHSLDVTDPMAALLITRVPAIASYLVVPQALVLADQQPTSSVPTLLSSLTTGSYELTFRVGNNSLAVPDQIRGNFNTANILGTTQVCKSWIYQLDKTVLPAHTVEGIPTVTLD